MTFSIGSLETNRQTTRLILEFKIKAGQGHQQLERYRTIGGQGVDRLALFFVTLNGEAPSDTHWKSLTHKKLADTINKAATVPLVERPVWGSAWQAYLDRLEHYKQEAGLAGRTPVLRWLTASDRFVTTADHIGTLAGRIVPNGWLGRGRVRQGLGGKRILVKCQPMDWLSPPFPNAQDSIANNYNIHFELVLSAKGKASLQLHYETSPYMPEWRWGTLKGCDAFRLRKEQFAHQLKSEQPLPDGWQITQHKNCKAKAAVLLTNDTTVKQLQLCLQNLVQAIKPHIDNAWKKTLS